VAAGLARPAVAVRPGQQAAVVVAQVVELPSLWLRAWILTQWQRVLHLPQDAGEAQAARPAVVGVPVAEPRLRLRWLPSRPSDAELRLRRAAHRPVVAVVVAGDAAARLRQASP
jgi:hypothetical protein